MRSILFLIETIQRNQFRCNYLKSKNFFSEFFSQLLKSSLNFEQFQKRMTLIAYVFPKWRITKNVVRSMS